MCRRSIVAEEKRCVRPQYNQFVPAKVEHLPTEFCGTTKPSIESFGRDDAVVFKQFAVRRSKGIVAYAIRGDMFRHSLDCVNIVDGDHPP